MKRGDVAIASSGMPIDHGRVFQAAADQMDCVIASREVGRWATGLLLESYATKGFHNKAKSCPWGPMAGFVMADPRFTKNPDTAGQRGDLQKAIKAGGGEIPLYISEERRQALQGELGRITRIGGNVNEHVYVATGPTGGAMKFVLRRTLDAPGAEGRQLWAVLYARGEVRLSNDLKSPNAKTPSGDLLPVMAMVDPMCARGVRNTYRAATTGDYDLWAVFPRRADYRRQGEDRRMVPGSDRFKQPIRAYIANEDEHRGNLTPRIARVREAINKGVQANGYRGGDVVHHSDEAGRPMVSSIDFPCIAFVPKRTPTLVENTGDLKQFLAELSFEFVLGLNPGWHRQLGIGVSMGGSYTV
jgi:hypothetical protein